MNSEKRGGGGGGNVAVAVASARSACLVCGAPVVLPVAHVPCVESVVVSYDGCGVVERGATAIVSRNHLCSVECAEAREFARSFEDDGVLRMVGAMVRSMRPPSPSATSRPGPPRDPSACAHCGRPGAHLSIVGARAVAAPALEMAVVPGALACSPSCALAHASCARASDPGHAFEINYHAHGGGVHAAPRRELLETYGGKLPIDRLPALASTASPHDGRALVRDVRLTAAGPGARTLTPSGSQFHVSVVEESPAPHARFGARAARVGLIRGGGGVAREREGPRAPGSSRCKPPRPRP